MGKMTRDEFVSRLEKLDKDIDWDKAYKFFERQTGKRTETSKGFSEPPNFLPTVFSRDFKCIKISSHNFGENLFLFLRLNANGSYLIILDILKIIKNR